MKKDDDMKNNNFKYIYYLSTNINILQFVENIYIYIHLCKYKNIHIVLFTKNLLLLKTCIINIHIIV